MGKYYIATSTLNFNNILATESISPEAYYTNRNFGYKRFTKVTPNPFSNSLIAYDKIPSFKIDESDFDDYPLIIEITEDLLSDDTISNKIKEGGIIILQLNKTIYLHPNRVKFLFFSEKDKRTCLIKAEPSLETKLLPVYNPKLQLIEKYDNTFKWEKSILSKLKDLPENNVLTQIDLDSKLNRLKGFYYSYFLGVILSSSIKPKPLTEEFRTITKSIVDFYNRKNKPISIDKRIIDELEEFKIKVNISEGNKNVSIEELIKAIYLEESGIKEQQRLIEFLRQTKPVKDNFYNQLERNIKQTENDNKITLLLDNFIEYINKQYSAELFLIKSSRIIKYISSLRQKEANIVDPLFVIKNINFNGYKVTQLSDDFYKKRGAELYQYIINDILEYPINDIQSFLEEKVNLALRIGEVLKDFVDDWENSTYRVYLNSLLDNIENFQPFDIKSHPSVILQSIAVFILKGDDPEKLIEVVRQNGISDYRIALGFWGAIFGFSALPKTLTNILFEEQYVEKTKLFYQDTQKKIHNSISSESLNIERIAKKQRPRIEEKVEKESSTKEVEKKHSIKKNNETSQQKVDLPKCPKCGSDMILREGKYGKFYGCSKYGYSDTSCDGKVKIKDLPPSKDTTNDLSILLIEFVEKNGHSKIADIIPFVKERINIKYNISNIESYIKEFLKEELQLEKVGKSKGVKKRDKGMFK